MLYEWCREDGYMSRWSKERRLSVNGIDLVKNLRSVWESGLNELNMVGRIYAASGKVETQVCALGNGISKKHAR